MIGEFELINRFFAPLAGAAGLGLTDDAAFLTPPHGYDMVISKDMLVAGVHFFADDAAKSIAIKALNVNLSDLAAKGAKPSGYLLGLALPESVDERWLEDFSAGLAQTQKIAGMTLMGGDTVKTSGSITLSITALGTVKKGTGVTRSGAGVGDGVYVSGTIGDAALGLRLRQNKLGARAALLNDADKAHLVDRYLHPPPRTAFGQGLPGLASASIDVSDGLIADLEHVARASAVGIAITVTDVPLSVAAAKLIESDQRARAWALTGGDDYELCVTCSPSNARALEEHARQNRTKLTRIGTVVAGEGVTATDGEGGVIDLPIRGYRHF